VSSSVVVVGAGIAGVRVVQALRRGGFPGAVTLVGAEPALPYDRPPLSKGFLAGTTPPEGITLLTADQAAELGVTLRLGVPAVRLEPAERIVELADGELVPFDTLVLATGGRARPSPWRPASGVHVLRTLDDAFALRADLAGGGPVVVVGAGFIGGEVASTCRSLGLEVTLVDPVPVPMARAMGPDLGRAMLDLHAQHGVSTRFGVGVEEITGIRGDLKVGLTDGEVLPCAVAVVGIGGQPADAWLEDSGLVVDDGVVCDDHGRTGHPAIFAVGDVARWGSGSGTRAEHWTSAVEQATCVASAILGKPRPVEASEFIWSDQYTARITILGSDPGALAATVRRGTAGDDEERLASVFGDAGGRLAGGATINWPRASILLRRLRRGRATFAEAHEQIDHLP
jgi:3-phenylpropionate/trans-cinnamate dioxygenase ferredoxin reductase component